MGLYSKYILPTLLNSVMKREEMEKHRPDAVGMATGVILEIGFGSGLNLPYYTNVTELYALDPSRELYDLAQERIAKASFPVKYLQSSAEEIPLQNDSVDSVVSTWSLCSIPHPEVALKEMFRVLKPGRKFFFIEHGKSPKNFIAQLQKFFTPLSKVCAGGCHMDREVENLLLEVGFVIEKLGTFEQKGKPFAFMYKGVAIK